MIYNNNIIEYIYYIIFGSGFIALHYDDCRQFLKLGLLISYFVSLSIVKVSALSQFPYIYEHACYVCFIATNGLK